MEQTPKEKTKEYYDSIPVYYCKSCGSLKIMAVDGDENNDYCDTCGSTEIGKASIDAWIELQETVYKNEYYGREEKRKLRKPC